MQNIDWSFLGSQRFWILIGGSISATLMDSELPTRPWYYILGKFISIVTAGFIAIRTTDRLGDKKVEAAKISADATIMNAEIVSDSPDQPTITYPQ